MTLHDSIVVSSVPNLQRYEAGVSIVGVDIRAFYPHDAACTTPLGFEVTARLKAAGFSAEEIPATRSYGQEWLIGQVEFWKIYMFIAHKASCETKKA